MNARPPEDLAPSIVRYLTGELSDREEIGLRLVLAQDPEQRQLYDELRLMWERSGLPRQEWDAYAALERIKRRRSVRAPFHFVPPRRARARLLLRVAASIAIVLGCAVIWRSGITRSMPHKVAQPAFREFSTRRGERATFRLSDGTRFFLAAESRLRVPNDYARNLREIYLDGEALFEVVHDTARPFRVSARGAVIEDLGTRFDVRAYADDSVVAVAVAEGKVAFGRGEARDGKRSFREAAPSTILRPGEVGRMAPDGTVTTATGAVVATYFAWTEERLRFYKTPLSDVARVVSRWYDLDVRIGDQALGSLPITAEFGVQSADELLHELALAAGAEVARSGKIVTLRSKS
jgi:transmembrane sensor